MNDISSRALAFVMNEIREPLKLLGIDEATVSPDFELVSSGVLDSMRFLELLGSLEKEFGFEIKLEEFDIEEVTVLKGLVRAVAASAHPDDE